MNDTQLRFFLSVVDCGSFSRAEEASFVTKQAILRQINALEDEVGTTLLNRSNSGVTLTPAGEVFYAGAKQLLDQGQALIIKTRNASTPEEVIRIGQVDHQALLNPVTELFQTKFPRVRIHKVIHPNHSGEYRVCNGIIDVGETFYTSFQATSPSAYTRLCDMPYLAAMRHGHPLASKAEISLSDLTAYPTMIFRPMIKTEYRKALESIFASHSENLIIRQDVDNQVDAAFECSSSDEILLTANCFIRNIPEICIRPLANDWSQEYGIIYMPLPSPTVQKYIDTAVQYYRKL